jgi:hypothetical protein
MFRHFAYIIVFCSWGNHCFSQVEAITLSAEKRHIRNGTSREWSEFPATSEHREFKIIFPFKAKAAETTLRLRQRDVKQDWEILLNGQKLGMLVTDEQDMVVYYSIPKGALKKRDNELLIKCTSEEVDDIEVGPLKLELRSLTTLLSEATVELQVVESSSRNPLPGRFTIINDDGSLQMLGAQPKADLAIRQGVVYTANGKALVTLPAGKYKLFAGRGFEYGVDSVAVELKPGDKVKKVLEITREVDTEGWISCDTHIHTFTYSRHGDATMEERAVTIAGEGIELPVMTDHNIYVDVTPFAEAMGVQRYFTPVMGDELTTKVGHFNVFKTYKGNKVFNHEAKNWDDIRKNINDQNNSRVIILNHARDVHNGFRPFGPQRHLSSAGTSIDFIRFPANAMEVLNSGSQQSERMNLFKDWFGMLNRGYYLTPVGSSDSHDVSRYIVGQGRTYIKGYDGNPGNINVDSAIMNFKEGRVMVSMGLMTKIKVNGQFGPGDIAPASDTIDVTVEVWGPGWAKADHVELYANGVKIREESLTGDNKAGLKWQKTWRIPSPSHDIFLAAIAEGPAIARPFWSLAKPYQPTSLDWTPRFMGSTGAVWVDADKNEIQDPAYYYATVIMDASEGRMDKIMNDLRAYDRSVAIQVAMLLWTHGKNLDSEEIMEALKSASDETKTGFEIFMKEIDALQAAK